jgi:hypothetical protein
MSTDKPADVSIPVNLKASEIKFLITLLNTPGMGFQMRDVRTVAAIDDVLKEAERQLASDAGA